MNTPSVVIAAFYHFADLHDYEAWQPKLMLFCKRNGLKGTILLAKEGVNSTISGSREAIDALFAFFKQDSRFAEIAWKESFADYQPFLRTKVRLKKEIVAMGVDDLLMTPRTRGEYVKGKEWDQLISDPETLVIDTRNDYEVKIGTFEGAINPHTNNFREFPQWMDNWLKEQGEAIKQKKVAMFCTGGIRCEKSTALLKHMGFEKVYHLDGGILQYLEDTGNDSGKWQGDCFVFDDRVAVNDQLEPSGAVICQSCYEPCTTDDLKESPHGVVMCQRCLES